MAAKKRTASVDDWESLRFFLEARRTRSLTEAARRLGVEHTTVSRRIGALEAALGVRLFDRTPTGYASTPAADALLPLAERIEEQVLLIERRAAQTTDTISGVVRVATAPMIAAHFVAPALPVLRGRHPGIVVELFAENRQHNLARGEADLAIRLDRPRASGLVTRKLGVLGHAFYASVSHPRRSLDAFRDDFVGYDESLAHLAHERWLNEVAPARRVVFRSNALAALVAAMRVGVGVGLLPCFVGDADPGLTRLQSALTPSARELWLVVHGELRRSPRVRAVLDFVVEMAEAGAPAFAGVPR